MPHGISPPPPWIHCTKELRRSLFLKIASPGYLVGALVRNDPSVTEFAGPPYPCY